MTAHAGTIGPATQARRGLLGGALGRVLVVLLGMAVTGLAGAPIAYMLWPLPAPVAPDAPSLPITIGGVVFNVPPAAIRFAGAAPSRRAGAHRPRLPVALAHAARCTGVKPHADGSRRTSPTGCS